MVDRLVWEKAVKNIRDARRYQDHGAPRSFIRGHIREGLSGYWFDNVLLRLGHRAIRPEIQLDGGTLREHVTPHRQIADGLVALGDADELEIFEFLRNHYRVCYVPAEVNAQLTQANLGRQMPDGWAWGGDPWDRYRAAQVVADYGGLEAAWCDIWADVRQRLRF